MSDTSASIDDHAQHLRAAERLLAVRESHDDLIRFTQLTMPDRIDPDDPNKSAYDAQYFHRALAAALQEVEKGEIKRLIITFPPRHGKLLADSTPVLTTNGWTTHGELKAGDYVFGADGRPTRVVAVSAPDLASYEVEFTDGSRVKAHPNHEWTVFGRGALGGWRTMETRELAGRKLLSGKTKPRATYQLPLRPCVEFPEAVLPLHPYVFGAWLGDGTRAHPRICHAANETEVAAGISALGYAPSNVYAHPTTGVITRDYYRGPLAQDLRLTGAYDLKHIPDAYKHASVEQRLHLLAGLIDTDGHVETKTGRVRIATVSERLADDMIEVVRSLGWHACKYEQAPSLSTSGIQGTRPVFYVGFQPDTHIPTRLPRKKITRFATQRRVGFKSIRPCAPEVGRCIQVEAEDGLYLVGRELIATHNSELTSKRFIAWFIGRDPYRHVALGTYNATFAEDYGRDVRSIMNHSAYAQIFPKVQLKKDSQAADRMNTVQGGALYFVGRGGSITGRGAHLMIIDDPLKGHEEADSPRVRNELWNWFNKDIMNRFMDDQGRAIVIQTRWHEDDLVGRLTDPKNEHYNAERAAEWKIINIPAIAEENDILGREPGAPLWPSRFGLKYLLNYKRDDARAFNALYQQRPTAEEGEFFKAENWIEYNPDQVPPKDKLRVYMASDHAVAEKQHNDRTCILIVGIDVNDNIWVLDCWWKRAATDIAVEKLIDMIAKWKPLNWWAEDDHITKSIGPFLRKRMRERKVYMGHSKVNSYSDKRKKAQAIQGRYAMNMVLFPRFAPWREDAKDEVLKFPHGTHDDFVDALSTLGRGLGEMIAPSKPQTEATGPRIGTFGWIKTAAKERDRAERRRISLASM